jgi:hypothetical protein
MPDEWKSPENGKVVVAVVLAFQFLGYLSWIS